LVLWINTHSLNFQAKCSALEKFRQSFRDAVYGSITVESEQSFETAKLYARIFNIFYLTIQHKVKQHYATSMYFMRKHAEIIKIAKSYIRLI